MGNGISKLVGRVDGDDVGLRTSRMFKVCGMCLFEFFFFFRHNAVDEKDRRKNRLLVRSDVARILGNPAFIRGGRDLRYLINVTRIDHELPRTHKFESSCDSKIQETRY